MSTPSTILTLNVLGHESSMYYYHKRHVVSSNQPKTAIPLLTMEQRRRKSGNLSYSPKTQNPSSTLFSSISLWKKMAKKEILEVVKSFEIKRYMGRWYSIALFKSRFDQPKNGVNVRATYTLREDGTVHVLNETWCDGKRGYIEGNAYKAEPNSDVAKLKVKFYLPPFLPIIPVVADYWVLYIDEDYQVALVGQPSRNFLWILSRQTHLDEEIYNQLVQRARDEGYDVSKLQKTPHSDTPPEVEEGSKDINGIWWIKSMFLGK